MLDIVILTVGRTRNSRQGRISGGGVIGGEIGYSPNVVGVAEDDSCGSGGVWGKIQ